MKDCEFSHMPPVTVLDRTCRQSRSIDLGYFDDTQCRMEPLENPFGPKVLPMSPE